jgi:hypothetical protein
VAGVRPFAAVAATSAIAPGAVLGNITEVTSLGFSNYDAAWISISRRDARGLQLEASYTLSQSRDTNSLNSNGFAVQDGNDIAASTDLRTSTRGIDSCSAPATRCRSRDTS